MIIINPKYESLRTWIEALPGEFEASGIELFRRRNVLKAYNVGDLQLVVKRFKPLGLLKGAIYTWFRPGKAVRSYQNALKLMERGIGSPEPVAYIEQPRHGLLHDAYYICLHTEYESVEQRLNRTQPFDAPFGRAFAACVARLHEQGILHFDLNSGNILYRELADGTFDFQLIDLNRMRFMPAGEPAPMRECLENLTLFTRSLEVHAFVAREYAVVRGLEPDAFVTRASQWKVKHDRNRKIKKKIVHPVRTLKELLGKA